MWLANIAPDFLSCRFLVFQFSFTWKRWYAVRRFHLHPVCISITQCMYADESPHESVCASECVFLQLPPPSPVSSHFNKCSFSPLLPLHLSLIYIAMTPVSVTLAPCCEFHLSRKTSGDCYANGYVVGQMVMFASLCVRRGGKRRKKMQKKQDGGRKRQDKMDK